MYPDCEAYVDIFSLRSNVPIHPHHSLRIVQPEPDYVGNHRRWVRSRIGDDDRSPGCVRSWNSYLAPFVPCSACPSHIHCILVSRRMFKNRLALLITSHTTRLASLVFESFLFILTLINFVHSVTRYHGTQSVLYVFVRDGTWAFTMLFGERTFTRLSFGSRLITHQQ